MVFFSIFMRLDFLQSLVSINFFRMILYIVISATIVAIAVLMIVSAKKNVKLFSYIDNKVVLSGFAFSLLIMYIFMSLVPFTNTRAYTIFSLGYLYENSDKSYSMEEIEQVFIDDFVIGFGATEYRIIEQLDTGYITMDPDGKYRISERGKRFIELMRLLDVLYPVHKNPSSLYPDGNPDRPLTD